MWIGYSLFTSNILFFLCGFFFHWGGHKLDTNENLGNPKTNITEQKRGSIVAVTLYNNLLLSVCPRRCTPTKSADKSGIY